MFGVPSLSCSETVERVLKDTGMGEEELAGLLDLRRALPE